MLNVTSLVVASLLAATPYRVQIEPEAEPEKRDPDEGDDPWAEYEEPEAPAPAPAPTSAPSPTVAPQPAAAAGPPTEVPPERPRKPRGGLGLLVAGPLLVAAGVPFSFWGNRVFRNGCVDDGSNKPIDEAIGDGFACGLSATGSFLLHGVAFLLYAGGGAMTGVGGLNRGKHDAWEDAFITRDPRNVTGLTVGGGVLFGISLAALIGSRIGLWVTMDQCLTVGCVKTRQTIASSVAAGSMVGVAAGGAMLGYGIGYSGRMRRWAPELIVTPSFGPRGYAGLSMLGRF